MSLALPYGDLKWMDDNELISISQRLLNHTARQSIDLDGDIGFMLEVFFTRVPPA